MLRKNTSETQDTNTSIDAINGNESLVSWLIPPITESAFDENEDAEIKAEDVDFQRVNITGEKYATLPHEEKVHVSHSILKAISIRQKYMAVSLQSFNKTTLRCLSYLEESKSAQDLMNKIKDFQVQVKHEKYSTVDSIETDTLSDYEEWPLNFTMKKGVVNIDIDENVAESMEKYIKEVVKSIPHLKRSEFIFDFKLIKNFISDGPINSFCFRRLSYLSSKSQMHVLLNAELEATEQKKVRHRDFYNVRKVDNHIHAASSMNQKHLLRFIKKTVKLHSDMKVCINKETNDQLGLGELFEKLKISCYDLNVDNLDVHADSNTFHRFDKFNLKYNPIGQGELRDVFLKTNNLCEGVFFAKIIKEVLQDLEESKYQYSEMRLSIYGKSIDEWDELAKWANKNHVYSSQNVWIIQIPRLYDVYKTNGVVQCFQDILCNIFIPLYEATNNPKSHPELFTFLTNVVGLDSVDDESKAEMSTMYTGILRPDEWNGADNPPYDYYIYYLFVNLMKLNHLRKKRQMNLLTLRPHCGEAGSVFHLISAFMVAENINHGLLLKSNPVLQYLFYLCQIGVSMSPLSNNSLFLNYHRNPLPTFLGRGLNVTISTDDPLQFHFTKEPLMEEYSIATQVWKLSSTDMCELARNSILMSGFSKKLKKHWLGENFNHEGVEGNNIFLSNLPNIRIAYRQETLLGELINLLISVVGSESSITIRRRIK